MSIRDLSPLEQMAAEEATVAELVALAVEVEAADAFVDVESVVDADVVDVDQVACVRMIAAVCMSAAASRCPSVVTGNLAGGDGCGWAVVGDKVEGEVLWMTQLSVD